MATIGTFTKTDTGYTGTVRTMTLELTCRLEAAEGSDSEKAPDYRIVGDGGADLGAAWNNTNKEDRPYVAVKLDDPALPAPVFANLVEQDGAFRLIWVRQ